MINKLISLVHPTKNEAIVWSVQGGHYVAQYIDAENNITRQAPEHFKSLSLATHWLKKQGVSRVHLHQAPAYFEMIGLGS